MVKRTASDGKLGEGLHGNEASNVLYYVSFVLGKTAQEKWKEVNMDCIDTTTRLTNIPYCPVGAHSSSSKN